MALVVRFDPLGRMRLIQTIRRTTAERAAAPSARPRGGPCAARAGRTGRGWRLAAHDQPERGSWFGRRRFGVGCASQANGPRMWLAFYEAPDLHSSRCRVSKCSPLLPLSNDALRVARGPGRAPRSTGLGALNPDDPNNGAGPRSGAKRTATARAVRGPCWSHGPGEEVSDSRKQVAVQRVVV